MPSHASGAIIKAVQARDFGRAVAIAARSRVTGPGVRRDLFGFIDIVCLTDGGILAIQCTTADGMAARKRKIETECSDAARHWLRYGTIEVWGWRKYATALDRRVWRPRIEEIQTEDVTG